MKTNSTNLSQSSNKLSVNLDASTYSRLSTSGQKTSSSHSNSQQAGALSNAPNQSVGWVIAKHMNFQASGNADSEKVTVIKTEAINWNSLEPSVKASLSHQWPESVINALAREDRPIYQLQLQSTAQTPQDNALRPIQQVTLLSIGSAQVLTLDPFKPGQQLSIQVMQTEGKSDGQALHFLGYKSTSLQSLEYQAHQSTNILVKTLRHIRPMASLATTQVAPKHAADIQPVNMDYAKGQEVWVYLASTDSLDASESTEIQAGLDKTSRRHLQMWLDSLGNSLINRLSPTKLDPQVALQLNNQTVYVISSAPIAPKNVETLLKQLPSKLAQQILTSAKGQNLYEVHLKLQKDNGIKTSQSFISPHLFQPGQTLKLNLLLQLGEITQWVTDRSKIADSTVDQQKFLQQALSAYLSLKQNSKPTNTPDFSKLTFQHLASPSTLAKAKPLLGQPLANDRFLPNMATKPSYSTLLLTQFAASKTDTAQSNTISQQYASDRTYQIRGGLSNIPLDTSGTQNKLHPTALRLMAPPSHLLNAASTPSTMAVQQAITGSGQLLESKLLALTDNLNAISSNKPAPLNIQRGLNAVSQAIHFNINNWFSSASINTDSPAPKVDTKSTIDKSSTHLATKESGNLAIPSSLKQDIKHWLIQNQFNLMQSVLNQTLDGSEQKKLLDGLIRLISPKIYEPSIATPNTLSGEGKQVLPSNLSLQAYIQRTLSQITAAQDASNKEDTHALRQLLAITQSISKIQQDQIINRSQHMQQPDSPDFQFSLPYIHDRSISWCELEYQAKDLTPSSSAGQRGWHIVLRFMQNHANAFAIEANLTGLNASISLWSEDHVRLKQLHSAIDLLKQKMIKAGFECSDIISKHGMPPKKQHMIEQGLVDVRT